MKSSQIDISHGDNKHFLPGRKNRLVVYHGFEHSYKSPQTGLPDLFANWAWKQFAVMPVYKIEIKETRALKTATFVVTPFLWGPEGLISPLYMTAFIFSN